LYSAEDQVSISVGEGFQGISDNELLVFLFWQVLLGRFVMMDFDFY
jgi:hypothetical protein